MLFGRPRLSERWARRLRLLAYAGLLAGGAAALAIANQPFEATVAEKPSATAGNSPSGRSAAAVDQKRTVQPHVVSRIPKQPTAAANLPSPDPGFEPVRIGSVLDWDDQPAADGPSSARRATAAPKSGGGPFVVVVVAGLALGAPILHRRLMSRRHSDAVADGPVTEAEPVSEAARVAPGERRPAPVARAAGSNTVPAVAARDEAPRSASGVRGSSPRRPPMVHRQASTTAVESQDATHVNSGSHASAFPGRPARAPQGSSRHGGEPGIGLDLEQASSRVSLYVKTDWS